MKFAWWQLPIRLIFAGTVHRSQGVTLDSAVVDLRGLFWEYGQFYVALSRVRDPRNLCVLLPNPKHEMSETSPDDVDLGIIVDPELVTIATGPQAARYNISDAGDMLNEATTGVSYSKLSRSDMAISKTRLHNIFSQVLKNIELLLKRVMTEGSESAEPCTRGKALQRTLMTATIHFARLLVHKAYREGFELATRVFALPD
jgi:hypothetical protein